MGVFGWFWVSDGNVWFVYVYFGACGGFVVLDLFTVVWV